MRMHRGSSKGVRSPPRTPESLPLSASPPPAPVRIRFEITRGGRIEPVEIDVPFGTLLRRALREAGQAAEGSAVLEGETPVPLDEPLERSRRFTVVPTFSGG